MIAKFFIIFISLLVVLGAIGLWMVRRDRKDDPNDDPLSERNVENVNDLQDRFNRARYQDRDGE